MNKKESGFTLVELLQVIVIIGIILALIIGAFGRGCRKVESSGPEEFVKNFTKPVHRTACMQYDSDGDGYVSCTVFFQDGTTVPIECAVNWSPNEGCRLAKNKFPTQ